MVATIINVVFGLVPTLAFAWSLAADQQKSETERVVVTAADERRHNVVFALVYGLWSATLAMWNWMRGWAWGWIALWLVCAVVAFAIWAGLGRRTPRAR